MEQPQTFNEQLPPPVAQQAEVYWEAHEDAEILGRCVCLGPDDTQSPVRHYHWGICRQGGDMSVQDFWREEIWTTAMYRANLGFEGRCPDSPRSPSQNYGDITLN